MRVRALARFVRVVYARADASRTNGATDASLRFSADVSPPDESTFPKCLARNPRCRSATMDAKKGDQRLRVVFFFSLFFFQRAKYDVGGR